jgi:hypothetical protein
VACRICDLFLLQTLASLGFDTGRAQLAANELEAAVLSRPVRQG